MRIPIIDGDRIRIRPLNVADSKDVFEFTSMEEVTKFLTWEPHNDISVTENFLIDVCKSYDHETVPSQWGIELKNENKIIGITGYISIDSEHERAEIAYIVSPNYSGQGYMTEANKLVLNHGFYQLNLNRIQAKAEVDNVGSQKVLLKLGFKEEGLHREYLKVKGLFRSYIFYSMLKSELVKSNYDR